MEYVRCKIIERRSLINFNHLFLILQNSLFLVLYLTFLINKINLLIKGFSATCINSRSFLSYRDVTGLWTLFPFCSLIIYDVSFIYNPKFFALALNSTIMHENIWRSIIWCNEPIAFLRIKPFYSSFNHRYNLGTFLKFDTIIN